MVDAFRIHIMQTKELGTCPVRQIGGCSFFYMRISNVYIVIVVSSNANVACAFKFVVEVVKESFILFLFIYIQQIYLIFRFQNVQFVVDAGIFSPFAGCFYVQIIFRWCL